MVDAGSRLLYCLATACANASSIGSASSQKKSRTIGDAVYEVHHDAHVEPPASRARDEDRLSRRFAVSILHVDRTVGCIGDQANVERKCAPSAGTHLSSDDGVRLGIERAHFKETPQSRAAILHITALPNLNARPSDEEASVSVMQGGTTHALQDSGPIVCEGPVQRTGQVARDRYRTNRAIRMMIGIGTPSIHSNRERMVILRVNDERYADRARTRRGDGRRTWPQGSRKTRRIAAK